MYAVIRTGGKQYRVSPGDTIRVEKLPGEVGAEHLFEEVLLLGGDTIQVGKPVVAGAKVKAEITGQNRAKKIIIFKMKRTQNYRRKNGHRQHYTELKVKEITS